MNFELLSALTAFLSLGIAVYYWRLSEKLYQENQDIIKHQIKKEKQK
ncbi:hypothetical protein [Tenacibaculum sp. SZ-18]|nr:hypothetical protein [Tenacibaculum sp. SZ-18]